MGLYRLEGRVYKDNNGSLFESRDNFLENEVNQNPLVSWASMSYNFYHNVEILDSVEPGKRSQLVSGRIGFWEFDIGTPGIRVSEYRETLDIEDERIFNLTKSYALLWMGKGKFWNYMIGREFRENGESFTSAGMNWRGNGWKLGGSVLFQKEGNTIPTPIERFSGMDRPDIAFTDRKTVFRIRLKTDFLDWNVTASDRMGRKGSLFFMNLQFLYKF